MGTSSSSNKEEAKENVETGLFAWQKLSSQKETIHYDPRFEDIEFTENGLYISDFHNRIFEWEGKLDADQQPTGYHLKTTDDSPFIKYEYENAAGKRSGKRFDVNATSLAWIVGTKLHYFDLTTSNVVVYDVSEWLTTKYGAKSTTKIPPKAIINLGDGQVLFMVRHSRERSGKFTGQMLRGTDIIHVWYCPYSLFRINYTVYISLSIQMDIGQQKEMKTISIESDLLKEERFKCVYWGFQLNPNGKEISVLIAAENNVSHVCFVSLSDGSIVWQSRFDFVHDLSFNSNGKFACIFERPRKTEYGYVHVLNLTRLEWVCQIQLT